MPNSIGIEIIGVAKDSLSEGGGIVVGDKLIEINGEVVIDHLNYQFLVSQRDFTDVLVRKKNGALEQIKLENGGGALGLELAPEKIKTCRQNCVFCFVQQMPHGFRKSLYLKDEDIRLSFLYGHFTTLSNSDNAELDRIIREKLSPIHVSVHATVPEARAKMVGNPSQGTILEKIDRLISGGIEIHTQVVIVPNYNDGSIWVRTLSDLWERRAYQKTSSKGGILSLSCIPVGITEHRQNLPHLEGIDTRFAINWLNRWKREARKYAKNWFGEPWLLLADEWFTKSSQGLPSRRFYPSNWNQIENGIGLVRRFQDHSKRFIKSDRAMDFNGLRLLLLTGSSFAPYLSQTIESLNIRANSDLQVAEVDNTIFGKSVSVAGLLCGKDLLDVATCHLLNSSSSKFDAVVVPSSSVRIDTEQYTNSSSAAPVWQFLDDMTIAEMQSRLKIPIISSGENLSQLLINIKKAAK
ncbi:MAG: DUF512 domain-containing protein [Holophagaceae bacterium]|nr:DUF512 domain-containing protein [Holophagaceae bacterium]